MLLNRISRRRCRQLYPLFPISDNYREKYYYPDYFASYILFAPAKSYKSLGKNISTGILKFAQELEYQNLIFLGDTNQPLLYQQNNDYKFAKEAWQFLNENKIGLNFNGGINIISNQSKEFLTHIFWLARSNAAFPDIYFSDVKQNIIGHICKYGNLHLSILNESTDIKFKEFMKKHILEYFKEDRCYNWFSNTSKIIGRKTVR